MNLLKKPFSISLQALAGVLIFSCLLAHPFSEAASSPPGDKRDYMLVLNTYTESAPWSSHIINSIVAHIDQVDNFEVYTENMNSLLMTFKKHKTGEIESFKNNLLREYGKNPPRMLVLLGAPIAVLRDFVKQTWPGVPLILCSEMDYIGPENAYLDRRPLRPEERLPLCDKANEPIRIAVSRSHNTDETFEHIARIKAVHPAAEIVEQGSSYKFCLLAEGRVDYYVRTTHTYEWDTAAGELILAEAGGSTRTLPDGRELLYNEEDLRNPWFVCRSKFSKI